MSGLLCPKLTELLYHSNTIAQRKIVTIAMTTPIPSQMKSCCLCFLVFLPRIASMTSFPTDKMIAMKADKMVAMKADKSNPKNIGMNVSIHE